MKNTLSFLCLGTLCLLLNTNLFAQNVIITDDNTYTPASTNALLEVKPGSNNKGILIPRLTTGQRTAINLNATNDKGLMVYDTDTKTFWYYDGTSWNEIGAGVNDVSDADSDTKIQVEESTDEDYIRFDVAGNEAMVIDSNGNIGIGTASPGAKLEIAKVATSADEDALKIGVDGEYNASIKFFDDDAESTQFFKISFGAYSKDLSFHSADSSNILYLTNTGRVGIGTTSPTQILDVNGSVKVGDYILPSTDGSSGQVLKTNGSGSISWAEDTSSWTANGNNIYKDSGYVGIGTSSPTALLEIAQQGGYAVEEIDQQQTSADVSVNATSKLWQSFKAGKSGYLSKIDLWDGGTSIGTFSLNIYEGQGTSGTLIGTTGQISRNNSGYEYVSFELSTPCIINSGQTYTFSLQIAGTRWHADLNSGTYYDGICTYNGTTSSLEDTRFKTYVYGSYSDPTSFVVKDNGNVGLGTTDPSQRLVVNGNILQSDGNYAATDQIRAIDGDGLKLFDDGGNGIFVEDGGNVGIGTNSPGVPLEVSGYVAENYTDYGYLTETGAGVYSGTYSNYVSIKASERVVALKFTAISDQRAKTHICSSNISSDLGKIMELRPVNYKYIDSISKGNQLEKGFIAQEVEKVIPEAVNIQSDFVPDIFISATKIIEKDGLVMIELQKDHNLKKNDMVRLISPNEQLDQGVVQIISNKSFAVKMNNVPEKLFVYGKKVDDFRTVNYDYIFSTGIGAIQELSLKVEKLESLTVENDDLRSAGNDLQVKNAELVCRQEKLEERIEKLEYLLGQLTQK